MSHAPGAAVADVLLARVAGVPSGALDPLTLRETHAAISRAVDADGDADRFRGPLTTGLHALVPGLADEVDLRRAALALRRDVYNGRVPRGGAERLTVLVRRLAPPARAALRGWLEAMERREGSLAAARAALPGELEAAGAALVAHLREPELHRALALASPDFADEVGRSATRHAADPGSRFARSGVTYLARAALKTSPFSGLTRVALGGVGPATHPETRRRVAPSAAVAVEYLLACARDPALAPALTYAANDTLREVDGRPRLLAPVHLGVGGFLWRREDLVDARPVLADLRALDGLGHAGYHEVLDRLGGPGAHARFTRLLDLTVIRPVAPWAPDDPLRLERLAEVLGAAPTEPPRALARRLRGLARDVVALGAADGPERTGLARGLRKRAREDLLSLGRGAGHWLEDASLVYEDVADPAGALGLPPSVREDLDHVAQLLRRRVFRTQLYEELLAYFVAEHGPDGTCEDVLGFLFGFLSGRRGLAALRRAIHADGARLAAGEGGPVTVGPGLAAPAVAVHFQLAARDAAAVARGEHRLVVNQLGHGGGGALGRFAPLLDDDGRVTAMLEASARARCHPESEVWPMSFAADWSDLQHAPRALGPLLRWPGDLPDAVGAGRDLADLRLTREPASDTLVLRRRDGRPVVPLYVGAVPPNLVAGPAGVLITLGDPWIVGARTGREPTGAHLPRTGEGRVVLRRARWTIPPGDLPRRDAGEDDVDFLVRVESWRRRHALPPELFLTPRRDRRTIRPAARKPLWLRLDSLHSLRAIERAVDADTALELVEALPGRGQHWVRGDDGEPRAAEWVAFVNWPVAGLAPDATQDVTFSSVR